MKIVRNDKLIKRNKIIGNVASIAGIAILIFGLIMSFDQNPTKTLISFIALIVGFIIAQLSTYFVTRFGREPRFDQVIANNLSKLSDDYTFYVYSTPVPMVLVGPAAIWIPVTTMAGGEIYYDKKWKQRGGRLMLKIFGQENIGKPAMDIDSNIEVLSKTLGKSLPENKVLPIKGILVSMHPDTIIGNVDEAPNLIVTPDALRRTIRKYDRKEEDGIQPAVLININRALSKEEE
ncbi:hypothetical protein JR338_02995 [Chloroflexota bacterium]|nr:hypothetical protein JR338_02995 [Chloroflexota bacterium]